MKNDYSKQMELLLWIDIETTGLNVEFDCILQIACVLTDFQIKKIISLPEITIKCEDSILSEMDPWCKQQHSTSGLIEKVKQSIISLKQAESEIIKFLKKNTNEEDVLYIAGNSVHFDKKFIDYWMPNLSKVMSHRIVDVTSIALLCKNTNEEVYNQRPIKRYMHTAKDDIEESISEYKYYKEYFLK